MSDLDAAVVKLLDARPEPEDVERMTADLLDKRRKPYGKEIFVRTMLENYDAYECKLCGANVRALVFREFPHTFDQHIAFHNDTEYRLRTLEGK